MTKFLALLGGAATALVLVGAGASRDAFAQAPAAAPAPATPPPASIAASNGDDKITVNFVNADIQSVIKTVGQHTGRNFILDPRVTGTVNIVSDRPVSRDLLYQTFATTSNISAEIQRGSQTLQLSYSVQP